MLKGNKSLYDDFAVPKKEKKPTAKELKAKLGVKTGNELVATFEEGKPVVPGVVVTSEAPEVTEVDPRPDLRPAIKNSPFDELFYRVTDEIRAGNSLIHLSFLERVHDLLRAEKAEDQKAHETFVEIDKLMTNNGF